MYAVHSATGKTACIQKSFFSNQESDYFLLLPFHFYEAGDKHFCHADSTHGLRAVFAENMNFSCFWKLNLIQGTPKEELHEKNF